MKQQVLASFIESKGIFFLLFVLFFYVGPTGPEEPRLLLSSG